MSIKRTLLATAAAIGLATGAAMAQSMTDTGTIKSIDADKREIVFDTDKSFVAPDVNVADLKVGDRVEVTYEVKDGQNTVTEVKPAS